jgi:hypothetical protein
MRDAVATFDSSKEPCTESPLPGGVSLRHIAYGEHNPATGIILSSYFRAGRAAGLPFPDERRSAGFTNCHTRSRTSGEEIAGLPGSLPIEEIAMREDLLSGDGLDTPLPGRRELWNAAGWGCVVGQRLPGVNVLANVQTHPSDEADRLHLPTVQSPSGDEPIEACIALPKGEAKHPAVVLIHHDAGLDEN